MKLSWSRLSCALVAVGATGCGSVPSETASEGAAPATEAAFTGKTTQKLTAPDSDYVLTPGGLKIHRSCVHDVPDNAHIDGLTRTVTLNGTVIKTLADCAYETKRVTPDVAEGAIPLPSSPAYQEYSGADACTNCGCYFSQLTGRQQPCQPWFNRLDSSVVVPSNPPTNNGQTVFLWSGLSRQAANIIMQPVLQWGPSRNGGGGYWTFANWFIDQTSGFAVVQVNPLTSIAVGDTYSGITHIDTSAPCPLNGSGCTWIITSEDFAPGVGLNQISSISVSGYPYIWNSAYRAVLEAYALTSCSDLPPGHASAFTGVQAYQPSTASTIFKPLNEAWTSVVTSPVPGPACSYSINNISQSSVTLNY